MFDLVDDDDDCYNANSCETENNYDGFANSHCDFDINNDHLDTFYDGENIDNSENSLYSQSLSKGIENNPYASGFDEEHPLPTYEELRNAGFTDFEAKQITYHTYTVFSEKELFDVLYSENPKEAYDAIMHEKLDDLDDHINRLITSI